MPTFTVERRIAAPRESVFRAASDFAGAPERISAILRVEMLTEGPVGRGTRFRETRRMFGREATEEMEVLEFESPARYVLGAENHGCRYRFELAFAAVDGGTDVRMTFQSEPLTFFAKVMGVILRPMMKKVSAECGKDLDDLKRRFESEGAANVRGAAAR